jgi:hypothetical protein
MRRNAPNRISWVRQALTALCLASALFGAVPTASAAGGKVCETMPQCPPGEFCARNGAPLAGNLLAGVTGTGICLPLAIKGACAGETGCEEGYRCFQPSEANPGLVLGDGVGNRGYCIAAGECGEECQALKTVEPTVKPATGVIKPRLQIDIPGFSFTDAVIDKGELVLPFLSDYIAGVYNFLVSIVGSVAAVMIMIGGFQYLTAGGDKKKVDDGKKRIQNAMLGLVLVLGSYALLYAINPGLVSFDALRVETVLYEPIKTDETLGTTTVATALDDPAQPDYNPDSASSGTIPSGGGATGSGQVVGGSYERKYSTCPITLDKTVGDASRREFRDKVKGILTSPEGRQRVLEIADIADACNVNWGSCGESAGSIVALAGVAGVRCLEPKASDSCNDSAKPRELFSVSSVQRYHTYGINCHPWKETITKHPKGKPKYDKIREPSDLGSGKRYAELIRIATENQQVCEQYNTQGKAVEKYRDYLFAEETAGRLEKGWPDVWVDRLTPGDRIVVYNGNTDLVGSHAAIYIGPSKSKGYIEVIQGGNGGKGVENKRMRGGKICVRKSCKTKMIPLITAWSPD